MYEVVHGKFLSALVMQLRILRQFNDSFSVRIFRV